MATPAATQALTIMPRFSAALACRPCCSGASLNADHPVQQVARRANQEDTSGGDNTACVSSSNHGLRRGLSFRIPFARGALQSQDVDLYFLKEKSSRPTGRRQSLLAMAMVGILVSQEKARAEETEVVDVPKAEGLDAPKAGAVDAPSLQLYVDEKEGFKLLRPALWNKVEKAGATVLFEDPAKRGNTIGVVVNPVRISSLKDFGTPDVVAEKLIAAERKKPSTNDAQLVRVQERQANGDIPLYCLEYTLDSSRGQKRILSAVTVASKKLYILNITYVDSAATPAPPAMAEAFTQVLNSFDLLA